MGNIGSLDGVFWISLAASTSGMIGTALVYFFGVPRQVDTGGINFTSLEGDQRYDQAEMARIARFKMLGNTGLALIFLAFLLQLLGLLVDR
jgi:hypothetical protein